MEKITPIGNPRPGHSHRWHVFDVKSSFVPVDIQTVDGVADKALYDRVEFAFMVCVCGAVVKSQVQDNPNAIDEVITDG